MTLWLLRKRLMPWPTDDRLLPRLLELKFSCARTASVVTPLGCLAIAARMLRALGAKEVHNSAAKARVQPGSPTTGAGAGSSRPGDVTVVGGPAGTRGPGQMVRARAARRRPRAWICSSVQTGSAAISRFM